MNGLPPPPRTARPLADVYDAAYTGIPNWDVGRPQAPFVHLAESGRVASPVLDVGCGTGELSLYLAGEGYDVLGIDLSRLAIYQARQKAHWRRLPARFLVWDALDLPRLAAAGLSFRTVLDSAMFHILGDRERDGFIRGLETVLEPGGLYCVLGDARTDETTVYGLSPAELATRFEADGGWRIEFSVETIFQRRWGASPAYFVGVRRSPDASG